ncbi:MAG: ABC transporter ATP-binding protein [Actinomycetota bacterium]|nr:ABC transporter ATP-binding protein [Actinomycetota bacterium]
MTTVSARGLAVGYGAGPVVCDLDLEVPAGAWVCLIGPNGAGKSSALRALAGLVPSEGDVLIDGESLGAMSRRAVARSLAFVPQNPMIPIGMTVESYVTIGRSPYISYLGTESAADIAIVDEVLEQLALTGLAHRELGSLSGGELQRTILARALAQRAPVLVLDEPTTSLDVGRQQQVLELVDELRAAAQLTVISAMHDLTLAGHFADTLVLLSGGRAVASGPPRTVLTEAAIARHYGATVRVVEDPSGISVIPTRNGARAGGGIGKPA